MNKKVLIELRSVPCERGALTYQLTRKKVKKHKLTDKIGREDSGIGEYKGSDGIY
ncbi:MAG: hypothetical protein NC251_11725 [Lachnoclostridium sp.]|nr:hypothetical protein [Lachnospira sp.]MCM1249086.1 hypothetical protein [Lachnoclostridium sp.]